MVRKAKLLEHDLAAAKRKEREEQMLSDVQAENEARLRRFKAQMEAETQMLQRLNEDAMRMRRLREMEDNTERAKLEAKLLALKPSEIGKDTLIEAEDETVALKSIKPPKRNDLVKEEALTVAPKQLETCKLLHPDSLESSKKPVNSFMRGPTQQKTTRATTATYPLAPPVANHNSTPLMATPAAQTSPWKNWTVPEHLASPGHNLHATPCHVQSTWGLIPAFPGPPQDAWIDELDELANIHEPRMTAHHHCNFSAFEHSLPKFDLSKFDGSPLSWPHWIGRFKSIVHDQPFLNDSQRLAYLQNIVTGAAKTEIQYLGEDGANYALALRMLKARFADAGKIVRAAVNTLRGTPSPRIQDHAGLAQLYQALRATVVTLHRQRFIADLLSETNLAMAVEKLPDPLASKWAMEVQKHEGQGRPNLFDLDRWLSEYVRAWHLLVSEPQRCLSLARRGIPRKETSVKASTLLVKGDPQLMEGAATGKQPKSEVCVCCSQVHPLYRCGEFKRKTESERYEVVKTHNLCFNCLKAGHKVRKCPSNSHCQASNCKKRHHSLLHHVHTVAGRSPTQSPANPSLLGTADSQGASPYVATTCTLRVTDRVVYL